MTTTGLPTVQPRDRGYNYFRSAAVSVLFQLLQITDPTPQQIELAGEFVHQCSDYTRSRVGLR